MRNKHTFYQDNNDEHDFVSKLFEHNKLKLFHSRLSVRTLQGSLHRGGATLVAKQVIVGGDD